MTTRRLNDRIFDTNPSFDANSKLVWCSAQLHASGRSPTRLIRAHFANAAWIDFSREQDSHEYWTLKTTKNTTRTKALSATTSCSPGVVDAKIWDRTKSKGVAPYFLRIMDALTKNHPVSSTYFALWCRGFDEGLVTLNPSEMAFESGFSGQRATQTWSNRMKLLRDLGFILTQPGTAGELSFALLLNPFAVLKDLRATGKIDDAD